jgi:hypothetical protein
MLRFFNKLKKDDKGQPNSGRERAECFDCGVPEGETHWNGCDKEICPFCLGQLISCGCCNEKLGLIDTQKYDESTDYLPPEIYKNGFTEEQASRWSAILEEKGRIPFILYPHFCAKCGKLWPDFFRVPDEEWERYIQPDMRDAIICKECFDFIKHVINGADERSKK